MIDMQPHRLQPHQCRSPQWQGEVTLDELLSDPVMPQLWRADRISEHDVRSLMAKTSARLQQIQDGAD